MRAMILSALQFQVDSDSLGDVDPGKGLGCWPNQVRVIGAHGPRTCEG